ncbi:unnamed protein product, partial [Mesorhabditis spiculigera]
MVAMPQPNAETAGMAEWEQVRHNELALRAQKQPSFAHRLFAAPFATRTDLNSSFQDLSPLSLEEQEKRILVVVAHIIYGWSSQDVHIWSEDGSYRIDHNITWDPKLRSHFETFERSLLYIYAIYQRTHEALSNPSGPRFPFIFAQGVQLFISKYVKPLVTEKRTLLDVSCEMARQASSLKVCAELSGILNQSTIFQPGCISTKLMDALEAQLRVAVSPQLREILDYILYKMREQWALCSLAWVTHGQLLEDPHFEFMIWPIAKMKQLNSMSLMKTAVKSPRDYQVVNDKFIGIRAMCPKAFEKEYQAILSAEKYVRLITAAGVRATPYSMHLDEKDLHDSSKTARVIRNICRGRSEQLLKHIHEKFDLGAAYAVVNAVFLSTEFDLSGLLIKVCGDQLYRPAEEVSLRQLNNRMTRIFEPYSVDHSGVFSQMRLEFASISFFEKMGVEFDGPQNPTVSTTVQLSWTPSTLLREIWNTEVVHNLMLVQRYLFVLSALMFRIDDRLLEVARRSRTTDRLPRSVGNWQQYRLNGMHQFLVKIISWTQDVINQEALHVQEKLGKTASVEDMCELLMEKLIAPIFARTHLCNVGMVTQVHQACVAIHNFLEDKDADILQVAFDAFLEARDVLVIHMEENR